MPWTILYDGTEQRLEAWGLAADLKLTRVNQGPDICTVSAPGAEDSTLKFAYGNAVVIKDPDGATWFQGKATNPQRVGSGSDRRIVYQFAGPWWDLERLVFQQSWNTYPGVPPALQTWYTSE